MSKVPEFQDINSIVDDIEYIFSSVWPNQEITESEYNEHKEKFIFCYENIDIDNNKYIIRKAINSGLSEIITILFNRGLDIYDYICDIIFNEKNLKILINNGLDLNKFGNNKIENSFHRVILSNSYSAILIALEAGGDINLPTKEGIDISEMWDTTTTYSVEKYPIEFCINSGRANIDIFKLLLENGAELEHIIPKLSNIAYWQICDNQSCNSFNNYCFYDDQIDDHKNNGYEKHWELINLFIDHGLNLNSTIEDTEGDLVPCINLIVGHDLNFPNIKFRNKFISQFRDYIDFDLCYFDRVIWGFYELPQRDLFTKDYVQDLIELIDIGTTENNIDKLICENYTLRELKVEMKKMLKN